MAERTASNGTNSKLPASDEACGILKSAQQPKPIQPSDRNRHQAGHCLVRLPWHESIKGGNRSGTLTAHPDLTTGMPTSLTTKGEQTGCINHHGTPTRRFDAARRFYNACPQGCEKYYSPS